MSLVFIGLGVLLLLLLMVVFKLNAFISLIIVSLIVAVLEGMTPLEAIASVEKGRGSTLGHLALVLGFGAMLGKLMADSGGAQRIAMTLIDRFGIGKIQWATMLTGFVIGIALFYETGFIILIPLV
ncbi:SLC13 family permease, partial [Staphylococcus haemolyticus]|uniref:GntT/GntP/DsdX family permease n=1 Tax=Staphylococcus haemolyticus TaxID=1283 RepID=UPI003989E51D